MEHKEDMRHPNHQTPEAPHVRAELAHHEEPGQQDPPPHPTLGQVEPEILAEEPDR